MTAPEAKFQNLPPAVQPIGVAQNHFSRLLPRNDDGIDENFLHFEYTTALNLDENGSEWATINVEHDHESRITREILDAIDTDTLRAARLKGGTKPQIVINRDRVAALLRMHENLKRPDEVYADEAWEICIVWRSEYGRVEIGTGEDGSIGYLVSRTLSDKTEESPIQKNDKDKIRWIFSWLEENLEDM